MTEERCQSGAKSPAMIDLCTQARKALCERSPYDVVPEGSVSSFEPTLPAGLACLYRQSVGRKRRRKSHFSSEVKANRSGKGGSIWIETEEYFRELTSGDVDTLSGFGSGTELVRKRLFLIPYCGGSDNVDGCGENLSEVFVREGGKVENGEAMDICVKRGEEVDVKVGEVFDVVVDEESRGSASSSVLEPSRGLEWLLGYRNKDCLTTERPTRKRKRLGTDAGLSKVLLPCPCEGNSSLCNYCCTGDTGDELNPLITCSSCEVTVHKLCYGVQEDSSSLWLCSWCRQKNSSSDSGKPCLLCAKHGGALKPVHKLVETSGPGEFAHLFCSMWMPEVYIEDLTKMEPVMNLEGIKDIRRKLICNICKVKHGACVRCSHGSCRTSFHPICAREAGHRMEIWGKYGRDDVELRAFCSKHSEVQDSSGSLKEDHSVAVDGESPFGRNSSVAMSLDESKFVGQRNSDKIEQHIGSESYSESGVIDASDDLTALESDGPDVKSVLQQQIKNNIRILEDEKVVCPSMEIRVENGTKNIEITRDQLVYGVTCMLGKYSIPDSVRENPTEDKRLHESTQFQDCWNKLLSRRGNLAEPANCCVSDRCLSERVFIPGQSMLVDQDVGNPACSDVVNTVVNELTKMDTVAGYYMHPYIHKLCELHGSRKVNISAEETFLHPGAFLNSQIQNQNQNRRVKIGMDTGSELARLVTAKKLGLLELSPEDELEGELIYFQHMLLDNTAERKRLTDNLVSKVAERLPHEIESTRGHKWDIVIVNQYLCELREVKKQARREQKHKEAESVLTVSGAVATAASRASAFWKDSFEESANQEILTKLNNSSGRAGVSQLIPWTKETLTRIAAPRISLERHSDFAQSTSNYSKEQLGSCDICRFSELILNPLLVCSGCKVAVHSDCYRSVTASSTPWYCELCEESSSSRSSGNSAVSSAKHVVVECDICGGSTGAFRKTTDGQWVHAFCAEWVFELKFSRGQVNPIEGVDIVSKGNDKCCICHQKLGVCIKCNYSHCQTTFHPFCARRAGFNMSVKGTCGRLQHKAYCEKHSSERRKAVTNKHGIEDLRSLRQLRVGLERLRLLCDRIIKREKVKHEIISCTNEIHAVNRDCLSYYSNMYNPFSRNDSSESATTSLRGHTDDYKSFDGAFQKSDDITDDSSVSVKHDTAGHACMDADQKTDDSSTTQQDSLTKLPPCRQPFIAAFNNLEDRERRTKLKTPSGTLEKELIMTSDQASMKNQLLPKGYIYVPGDSLPNK